MKVQLLPDLHEQPVPTDDGGSVVVVFDNDRNTFEEVEEILQRATGCSLEAAKIETWEIHHLGKSVVHHSGRDECDRVAAVISTIGIHVEVHAE